LRSVLLKGTASTMPYELLCRTLKQFERLISGGDRPPQRRHQPRAYLSDQSIVRCQAKSAAALL
jgi:hypothetical protein